MKSEHHVDAGLSAFQNLGPALINFDGILRLVPAAVRKLLVNHIMFAVFMVILPCGNQLELIVLHAASRLMAAHK